MTLEIFRWYVWNVQPVPWTRISGCSSIMNTRWKGPARLKRASRVVRELAPLSVEPATRNKGQCTMPAALKNPPSSKVDQEIRVPGNAVRWGME